jgi:hypothetical protein
MIQQVIVGLLFIIILIQVGVLRIDSISSMFQKDGYESDDEVVYKRTRHKGKKRKQKDRQMTPISSIIQEQKMTPMDPEDPEEIQRAIMNELNQHDALFLTPSPI